jgi:hypothetical protein
VSDDAGHCPTPRGSAPSLRASCAWLTLSVVCVWPWVAWYGYRHSSAAAVGGEAGPGGATGVLAATLAAGVALLGTQGALISSGLVRGGPQGAMVRLVCGMALRMGVPLLGGLWLSRLSELAGTGVFGMVVVFYLAALAVETPLSLRFITPSRRPNDYRPAAAAGEQIKLV